ncbi:hypothetical protein D5R81_12205 [Parashewanella spongiae]|uniref:IgGFc-binding protein N-terminal domain-containing protein n=1 Tax=Parashewanella spongiae TaxID=342950 RepID=A0A3A6TNP1_9GAMM|nr:hypothetical protein [Parashewanella spongiae]MCL1079749.1 hypothetical protein [Parashewanella spongiae]RJY12538.1 hypothetical protein D5R81_12205 [Parashewanella spongiae]
MSTYIIGAFSLFLLFYSCFAQAIPRLSEPSDVVRTKDDVVYISNTGNSSLMECRVVDSLLQECRMRTFDDFMHPFRLISVSAENGTGQLYISKKNTNLIYNIPTQNDGRIAMGVLNIDRTNLVFPNNIAANVIDMKKSPSNGLIYTAIDRANHFGQIGKCQFSVGTAVFSDCELFPNLNLPSFNIPYGGDRLVGIGRQSSTMQASDSRYAYIAWLNDDGSIISPEGGSFGVGSPAFPVSSFSLAGGFNEFWVTHNTEQKFTYFNEHSSNTFFPISVFSEDAYTAPSSRNVWVKTVLTTRPSRPNSRTYNFFSLFGDDNKMGECLGYHNYFTCRDVFRYLSKVSVVEELNSQGRIQRERRIRGSISVNSESHGLIRFSNVNYSSIESNEVTRVNDLPEEVMPAFDATSADSCLNKTNFTAKDTVNSSCILRYDFRVLSLSSPLTGRSRFSFDVNGSFNAQTPIPYSVFFDFNLLRVNVPHLVFRQRNSVIDSIDFQAGESGTIEAYNAALGTGLLTTPMITFNDTRIGAYFDVTACDTALGDGESCTVRYNIPASPINGRFKMSVQSTEDTSAHLVDISIARGANIVARRLGMDTDLSQIMLVPGNVGDINFSNVGGSDVNDFHLDLASLPEYIRPFFSGNCFTSQRLSALTDHCTLHYDLPIDTRIDGRYRLNALGHILTDVGFTLVIGNVDISGELRLTDSNTQLAVQAANLIPLNAQGRWTLTNATNAIISDLHLQLQHEELRRNNVIGGECFEVSRLLIGESCDITYQIGQDNELPRETLLTVQYDGGRHQTEFPIRFSALSIIGILKSETLVGNHGFSMSAINNQVTLSIVNNAGYPLMGLTARLSSQIQSTEQSNQCNHVTLKPRGICEIHLSLSDALALVGHYTLTVSGDNFVVRTVPVSIREARTDRIQVDNRGGYVMYVQYTQYHQNVDGQDSACSGGSDCYALASSGRFSNPQSKTIQNLHGRKIYFKIVAGKTRTLPSCDGGKVRCSRATLNPHCYYYSDGSGEANQQNNCAR